ncbi:hypothetical protein HZR84_11650 [Hyphobacterium sp. CCMP332]|nr:hypothetical protein HZR84_11650 [Hyphobacterium sp. CCMP332]
MDYFFKKILILLFPVLLFSTAKAQENQLLAQKPQYSYGFLNISADFGLHKINDSYLKSTYNARNAFQWNVGFELGDTGSDFFGFLKYGQYGMQTDFELEELDSLGIPNGNISDSSYALNRNRIAFGLSRVEKISKKSFLTLSSALIYNNYKDNSRALENASPGFLVGIGYLFRGIDQVDYFVKLNYEYGKTRTSKFTTDWSGLNLETGFSILISKAE